MATEEPKANDGFETRPNRLPQMKVEDVQARAQRIFDLRGEPPYGMNNFGLEAPLTGDEAAIISDFVTYWRPFLTLKKGA